MQILVSVFSSVKWSLLPYAMLGGGLGASARFILSALNGRHFPLGTSLANASGALFIGLILQYPDLSPGWRVFLITGFLGGLTTFSSFINEGKEMTDAGLGMRGLSYLGGSIFLGLLLAAAGAAIGRRLFAA